MTAPEPVPLTEWLLGTATNIEWDIRHGARPLGMQRWVEQMRSAATRIAELEADQAHCLGCEHNVEHGNRCSEGTCFRQWQADRIAELETAIRVHYERTSSEDGENWIDNDLWAVLDAVVPAGYDLTPQTGDEQ